MAGSYFQNHTLGISAIDLSGVTTSEKFLGSEIGFKSSIGDAGAIDITKGKTYSLKQLLQMRKVQRLCGNVEKVTVTYGGTVVASEQAVTIDGVELTVTPASATAAALATAVATAVNASILLNKKWSATADSAKVVLTHLKNGSSLFDETAYTATGAVTVTASTTKWGANKIVLTLYSSDSATLTASDEILKMTVSVGELADNGQTEYEITLPPNTKRYLVLGIKKATASDVLTGTSVFPIIPNQG